jgi:adenylate cyclase
MPDPLPRKLSAVLHADVAGYSRLTGEDEEGTHQILRRYLPMIAAQIEAHHGRVVHYAGDAVLAEFDIVTDALTCAVDAQTELAENNAQLTEDRRVPFRMGVNLGEVISDPPEIYGEGVNVAARLESLADVGGICVSESVRATIGHLLPYEFESMGEQEMKNIQRPVRVYRVKFGETLSGETSRAADVQEEVRAAAEKPRIVILPFETMGGGDDNEWFAAGITEDLTIELSRFRAISAVALTTANTYKDRSIEVSEVAKELGLEYVVQGSVRRSGDRVRVAVRLSDASGTQLWAERYDRRIEDVFELQDEMVQVMVAQLPERVRSARLHRVRRKPPAELAAYDLLIRARSHHHARTPEDNQHAQELLGRALALDPEYAQAHAWKACVIGQAVARGYTKSTADVVETMMQSADRSFALDQTDCECSRVAAEVNVIRNNPDQALRHHQRAYELNPNDPRIVAQRGEMAIRAGRPEEAIPWLKRSIALDPQGSTSRCETLALALQLMGDHAGALEAFDRCPKLTSFARARRAWALKEMGRTDEAERDAQVAKGMGDQSPASRVEWLHLSNPAHLELLREGLLSVGFGPED